MILESDWAILSVLQGYPKRPRPEKKVNLKYVLTVPIGRVDLQAVGYNTYSNESKRRNLLYTNASQISPTFRHSLHNDHQVQSSTTSQIRHRTKTRIDGSLVISHDRVQVIKQHAITCITVYFIINFTSWQIFLPC